MFSETTLQGVGRCDIIFFPNKKGKKYGKVGKREDKNIGF